MSLKTFGFFCPIWGKANVISQLPQGQKVIHEGCRMKKMIFIMKFINKTS